MVQPAACQGNCAGGRCPARRSAVRGVHRTGRAPAGRCRFAQAWRVMTSSVSADNIVLQALSARSGLWSAWGVTSASDGEADRVRQRAKRQRMEIARRAMGQLCAPDQGRQAPLALLKGVPSARLISRWACGPLGIGAGLWGGVRQRPGVAHVVVRTRCITLSKP